MAESLTIGEVSRRSGVAGSALRFYVRAALPADDHRSKPHAGGAADGADDAPHDDLHHPECLGGEQVDPTRRTGIYTVSAARSGASESSGKPSGSASFSIAIPRPSASPMTAASSGGSGGSLPAAWARSRSAAAA